MTPLVQLKGEVELENDKVAVPMCEYPE